MPNNWTKLFKLLRTIPKSPEDICVDPKPLTDKQIYYKRVWEITLSHDLNEVMQGFERGFKKYHIDHIIPISHGYKNNIPAEVIGAKDNLRPLHYKDNMRKGTKLTSTVYS